jgi:hypothetical protein
VSEAIVEMMDLFATILEVACVPARHTHFAKSLMPLISGTGIPLGPSLGARPACQSGGVRQSRRVGMTHEHRDFAACEGGARIEEIHTHENPHDHVATHVYHPRISIQNEQPQLHGKAVMLRTREWKYVRRLYDTDELYDVRCDPDELKNLVSDPACAGIVREMRDKMLTWFLDTGDAVPFRWDKRSPNERILDI